jgi:hypothetical protein
VAFNVKQDGWSILNMPNVVMELDVGPVFCDVIMEGLQIGDSFGLVIQLVLLHLDCSCVLHVLPLLRLQFDDILGPKVSKNTTTSKANNKVIIPLFLLA